MKITNETHEKLILRILESGQEVTSMDGLKLGIVRITNAVARLREKGHPILDFWMTSSNNKRHKVYYMTLNKEEEINKEIAKTNRIVFSAAKVARDFGLRERPERIDFNDDHFMDASRYINPDYENKDLT